MATIAAVKRLSDRTPDSNSSGCGFAVVGLLPARPSMKAMRRLLQSISSASRRHDSANARKSDRSTGVQACSATSTQCNALVRHWSAGCACIFVTLGLPKPTTSVVGNLFRFGCIREATAIRIQGRSDNDVSPLPMRASSTMPSAAATAPRLPRFDVGEG